ncbi:dCTP deaminase domain-containing protein [Streptomyces sp. NPDC090077]|uniref:dCTP deaminase n=1 Tax=Streptomyces sp. NPDC090077 TaxID=3365938 RepID=UPI003807ECC2
MILTGPEIQRQRALGALTIEPFDPALLNPVSYTYRLGPVLRTHRAGTADTHGELELDEVKIPDDGFVLMPGRVYLGTTMEEIGSTDFVASLIGRSSIGRLGLFVQYSADLGQLGACHSWTLELKASAPTIVRPGLKIGQVSFSVATSGRMPYTGRFGRINEATVAPPWLLAPAALAHT